jgi:hypothetical protein
MTGVRTGDWIGDEKVIAARYPRRRVEPRLGLDSDEWHLALRESPSTKPTQLLNLFPGEISTTGSCAV